MKANQRRQEILHILQSQTQPIVAKRLATEFGVSRQLIVGDIALLRAEGHQIKATANGYIYGSPTQQFHHYIVCNHPPELTEKELLLIVGLGGEIIDVSVEHPIYGTLTGQLGISSARDVAQYIERLRKEQTTLLSSLTAGIHIHQIACKDESAFQHIIAALRSANILYEDN